MAVYTIYRPPLKDDETSADPARFAFVRDRFSFWAFLLAPFWMLRHRMWLALAIYVAVAVFLQIVLYVLGAPDAVKVIVALLLSLLVGLEAGTLRRITLERRGWRNVGVVIGDDQEVAERRFFDSWSTEKTAEPSAPVPPPAMRAPKTPPDVIGLFPEPGAPR